MIRCKFCSAGRCLVKVCDLQGNRFIFFFVFRPYDYRPARPTETTVACHLLKEKIMECCKPERPIEGAGFLRAGEDGGTLLTGFCPVTISHKIILIYGIVSDIFLLISRQH